MSFKVPILRPADEIVAWWKVGLDRRRRFVEVFYSAFEDETHLKDPQRPTLRDVTVVSITGDTVGPLLQTEQNRLYDDVRALIGRLLTGTATAQEVADVQGIQALAAALAVEGVEHLDSDPFDVSAIGVEESE